MDNFDQGQSPRLGQKRAPESPGVQLRTLETLPEAAYRGMQVYLIDLNQTWVYDGEVWQAPESGGGGGGGGRTYVSPTPPVADNIGDHWLSTVDYQLYVWDGTEWRPVSNPIRQNETTRAANALVQGYRSMGWTTGSPVVWYTTTEPTPVYAGDVWVNVVTNVVKRRMLTSWEDVGAPHAQLFLDAEVPRHLADFKVQVFFGTPPNDLGPEDIGDVWVDNVVKVWMGAQWIETQVLPEELPDDIIGREHIQLGAIGPVEIDENAIGEIHLQDRSVTLGKIASGAVGIEELGDFIITARKFKTTKHQLY